MQRRCLREATGLAMYEIEAWADHLYSPEGTRLRDCDRRDVGNVRRKALYKDGRYWRPSSATQRPSKPGWRRRTSPSAP